MFPKKKTFFLAVFALLVLLAPCSLALDSSELLLLANRRLPASITLAEYYQKVRQVPPGRILALDLPASDDMTFAAYERDVVPAIRKFLRDNQLENKVKCIVTFFGVPLRIGPARPNVPERQELAQIKELHDQTRRDILGKLTELDAHAKQLVPSYAPPAGDQPAQLLQHAAASIQIIARRASRPTTNPADRDAQMAPVVDATRFFFGPAGVLRAFSAPDDPRQAEQLDRLRAQLQDIHARIESLQELRHEPDARAQLRKLVAESYGTIELLNVLQLQQDYLQGDNSVAAFDSELSLLWYNTYPRARWQPNPLFYGLPARPDPSRMLMTCRLDAPQSGQVKEIIDTSIKAETGGLKGKVVLDSRGIAAKPNEPVGSYAWYDQSIRNLADLTRKNTTLAMRHDESAPVIPADSEVGVALYCGWYSVGNYVRSCRFVPGAVGFHIASFELTSLRDPSSAKQWVRNLIDDGVVASLGPVAEPYLHAFPRADDFFPLLLTGQFTLAEVYWRTQPLTSWMMTLIGDPLYTPYKSNPALQIRDLPMRLAPLSQLRAAPTTRP